LRFEMALGFIEEIYYYSNTIYEIRRIVEQIRIMDDERAVSDLKKILRDIERFCNDCIIDGFIESDILKENLIMMGNIKDIILLADVLERSIIPIMERWIQSLNAIDMALDDRFHIKSTRSGFLTIKDVAANRYIHSNNDPMNEAYLYVKKRFKYEKRSYNVLGCGLGYHVYQLYSISDGSMPIRVYDTDPNLVRYAYEYGVLDWIPKNLLQIEIIRSNELDLDTGDYDGVIVLYPFVESISDSNLKSRIAMLYSKENNQR